MGTRPVRGQYGGRLLASARDQVLQPLLRLPEPHVEHLLDADAHEVNAGLARGGAREKGLATSGGAVKQQAATHLLAEGPVEIGPLERGEDAEPDLFLELLETAHVGKGASRRQVIRRT